MSARAHVRVFVYACVYPCVNLCVYVRACTYCVWNFWRGQFVHEIAFRTYYWVICVSHTYDWDMPQIWLRLLSSVVILDAWCHEAKFVHYSTSEFSYLCDIQVHVRHDLIISHTCDMTQVKRVTWLNHICDAHRFVDGMCQLLADLEAKETYRDVSLPQKSPVNCGWFAERDLQQIQFHIFDEAQ